MAAEIRLKVKPKFINKFKNGYPLITKEAIVNINDLKEEGTVVKVVDDRNSFIGRGYYGKQNKGFGWILTRNNGEQLNQQFFKEKIKVALHGRSHFFGKEDTTAFRVVNGEGDGLGGITIDYFDGYYVINWYSEGIYTFREYVINALSELVDYKAIYQKKRFATDGKYIEEDGFVTGERGQFPILVKENGVHFAVYLDDGAMVGVFLDQREVRKTIRDKYVEGKSVLNLFSYTGAFSVFAASGGASKTTSVDLANRSLSKTIEQFEVNSINYKEHDIIVEDVFKYFKYAVKKEKKFDVVILDPPSFARSKKFTFSAAKDYTDLIKQAILITEHNGMIVASTNSSAFNMNKFKKFIEIAFKEMGRCYKIIEQFSLPEDFRTVKEFEEGNYLKVVFIQITGE
ncbi:class I SAM-dependent rRNA methyltransferase [Cytobacillus sp. IB215316]|uniref:class I SAM-dependent rRNA methyltransferase n=1 Tax=Cytobacillus sp. IB215316 TaxID=3097354 RepID=UPI002A10CA0D|nr:class I SAM-dependent rRNA methyltransferase [Cytobacillus sp. IB215316]MDX8360967.1 class I SAM-dependent rRNA methyltransferase [Cytobacillus sp. IB215316]